jgi:hypothetical protein
MVDRPFIYPPVLFILNTLKNSHKGTATLFSTLWCYHPMVEGAYSVTGLLWLFSL